MRLPSAARWARLCVSSRGLAASAGGNANTSMDLVSEFGLSEEQREVRVCGLSGDGPDTQY